jgi:hypothetical protein
MVASTPATITNPRREAKLVRRVCVSRNTTSSDSISSVRMSVPSCPAEMGLRARGVINQDAGRVGSQLLSILIHRRPPLLHGGVRTQVGAGEEVEERQAQSERTAVKSAAALASTKRRPRPAWFPYHRKDRASSWLRRGSLPVHGPRKQSPLAPCHTVFPRTRGSAYCRA